jgi:hypothetical protein
MKEELNKYTFFLKGHLLKVKLILSKIEGSPDKESLEDFSEEEKLTMRAIYDMYLNKELSLPED